MKKIATYTVLFNLVLSSFSAFGNDPGKNLIQQLKWLEGRWVGEGFGGTVEEIWSPPSADGVMMGVFRHHNANGELVFYEFMLLDETGLRFKHFSPDLNGWETKDEFVTFEMINFSSEVLEVDALKYERQSETRMQITAQFKTEKGPSTEVLSMKKDPVAENTKTPGYAWLSGNWTGDGFGGTSEEIWSSPSADGTMFGAYRHHKGDGSLNFYEFMVLNENSLRLKHFTPELIGWETRDKYVTFEMIAYNEDKIELKGLVFEQKSKEDMEIRLRLRYQDRVETEVFTMKRK